MDLGRRHVSVHVKPFKRQAIYLSVRCPVLSLLLVWWLIANCLSEVGDAERRSKHTLYRHWIIVIEAHDHLFRSLVSVAGVGRRCQVGRIIRSSR